MLKFFCFWQRFSCCTFCFILVLTLLIALVPHVSPSVLVLALAHALAATGSRTVRRGRGGGGRCTGQERRTPTAACCPASAIFCRWRFRSVFLIRSHFCLVLFFCETKVGGIFSPLTCFPGNRDGPVAAAPRVRCSISVPSGLRWSFRSRPRCSATSAFNGGTRTRKTAPGPGTSRSRRPRRASVLPWSWSKRN